MRRLAGWLAAAVGALVIGAQFVPYGRDHVNPPITQEPPWDRPETRALAVRACFDCHSNETTWPWYSEVAPVSWLIQRDVDEGRRALNYSEWDRGQREGDESARSVAKGDMPPWFYVLPGTRAQLTAAERQRLVAGLEATFGSEPARDQHRERKNDDD